MCSSSSNPLDWPLADGSPMPDKPDYAAIERALASRMTLEEVAKLEYVSIRGLGGGRIPMEVHKVTGRSVWLRGTSSHQLYVYPFKAFWALDPRPSDRDKVRKGDFE